MKDVDLLLETVGQWILRVVTSPRRWVRRCRARLIVARRCRCLRHGHPMADWSPVCMMFRGSDTVGPDGTIIPGTEIVERAWRCAIHDKSDQ